MGSIDFHILINKSPGRSHVLFDHMGKLAIDLPGFFCVFFCGVFVVKHGFQYGLVQPFHGFRRNFREIVPERFKALQAQQVGGFHSLKNGCIIERPVDPPDSGAPADASELPVSALPPERCLGEQKQDGRPQAEDADGAGFQEEKPPARGIAGPGMPAAGYGGNAGLWTDTVVGQGMLLCDPFSVF